MSKPTLRSIAKAIGLSAATVSLALRDHQRIPRKTRDMIKEYARSVGYSPNPSISQLMTHIRSGRQVEASTTLALLNTTRSPYMRDNSGYHHNLYEGIKAQSKELGYKLEEFWIHDNRISNSRLNQILISRGIQGVIIPPLAEFGSPLELDWNSFSTVTVGYSLVTPRLNRIVGNQRQAIFNSLQKLLQSGHKRIGAIWTPAMDARLTFIASSVYDWYQNQIPKERRIPFFQTTSFSDLSGSEFKKWLNEFRPDGIITHASQAHSFIIQNGVKVPEDISVVVQGSLIEGNKCSGWYVSSIKLGERLVKMLDSQLQHHDFGVPQTPVTILVDMEWHEGNTITPRGKPDEITKLFEQAAW